MPYHASARVEPQVPHRAERVFGQIRQLMFNTLCLYSPAQQTLYTRIAHGNSSINQGLVAAALRPTPWIVVPDLGNRHGGARLVQIVAGGRAVSERSLVDGWQRLLSLANTDLMPLLVLNDQSPLGPTDNRIDGLPLFRLDLNLCPSLSAVQQHNLKRQVEFRMQWLNQGLAKRALAPTI